MPSPFPGMDPFIESQEWSDFHTRAINIISDLITPGLGEHYVARVERRVYIDDPEDPSGGQVLIPDVSVTAGSGRPRDATWPNSAAASVSTALAVECRVPQPVERRESFLVLRDLRTERVVTVIELLSPTNKRPGGRGRRRYLAKRSRVLDSPTNLVEIDLLRGGRPMPRELRNPLPADYTVLVSRSRTRPGATLFAWRLRDPLPSVPVPLRSPDLDVTLPLAAVLETVYDRARYDLRLAYEAPLAPPADEATAAWIGELIESPPRHLPPSTEPFA